MYASNIVLCLVWTKSIMYNMVQKKIDKKGQEFEVEERVMRFANIQRLYESILGAMINE